MDFSPRYLGGDSFLGRRDPRVLILVPVATVIAAAQIQDVRWMAGLAVLALIYYFAARIPFRAVRSNWALVAIFVLVFAGINGIVVGATTMSQDSWTLVRIPVLDLPITVAALSYAGTMLFRFLAIVAVGFPLAFALRPGDLAVALAKLGVPSRFAYGIDLTFKFLPSASANLRETIAAQRLRGYERTETRNPIKKLLQVRPLLVPLTINSFVDAEDTVDALDLRGFGTRSRTWLRVLRFGSADYAVVAFAVLVAVGVTAVHVAGRMPALWLG